MDPQDVLQRIHAARKAAEELTEFVMLRAHNSAAAARYNLEKSEEELEQVLNVACAYAMYAGMLEKP